MLEQLLDQWRSGYEVVYAVRRSRKEGLAKRTAYRTFYRLYRRLAPKQVAYRRIANPRSPGPRAWRPFPGVWGIAGLPIEFLPHD